MRNRSVPADIVVPHVVYQDLEKAIAWLSAAFGFTEHFRYGEPISGAQLLLGRACIMAHDPRPGSASPAACGCRTQSLTIFVEEVDAHYERAKAAGAKIVEEPHETVYGEYQCAAEDLEGHLWIFSRHARDLDPREWGAQVAE